jgi:hypothetical protein
LALVDEEDGMVLMVDVAEELVGVVCPYAQQEINDRAVAATRIARVLFLWTK